MLGVDLLAAVCQYTFLTLPSRAPALVCFDVFKLSLELDFSYISTSFCYCLKILFKAIFTFYLDLVLF